jgi:hypothetical protein
MIFKKCDKMPASIVLLTCSWLVALVGLVAAGYRIVSGAYRVESIFTAFLIFLASIVTAGIIRMVANIGQFLLEIRDQSLRLNTEVCEIKTNIQDIKTKAQELKILAEGSRTQVEIIKTQLSEKKDLEQKRDSLLEQIGCDSKDLSQNINQIKVFFEQIERHLDLKK